MAKVVSFPPIASTDAIVLILGSMPGVRSLEANRYYAHPHNCFWYIIENLLTSNRGLDYSARVELLRKNNIALWDVLQLCLRKGSLDSAIDASSIVTQNFESFYASFPNIQTIFFNGATAEKEYLKRAHPLVSEKYRKIPYHRLPSTSPAMASLTKEEKLDRWKIVKLTAKSFETR
jgi:hypoxanthine-DNA glycosylase